MIKQIKQFLKEEDGVTAIEYGLIAGLVSIVCITALIAIGPKLSTIYTNITNAVSNAALVAPAVTPAS